MGRIGKLIEKFGDQGEIRKVNPVIVGARLSYFVFHDATGAGVKFYTLRDARANAGIDTTPKTKRA